MSSPYQELNQQITYVNSLTYDNSLIAGSYLQCINEQQSILLLLRKGIYFAPIINICLKFINYFDNIFDKCPPSNKPLVFYRGIGDLTVDIPNDFLSYPFASTNIHTAKKYAKTKILKINVPVGSKFLPIGFKDIEYTDDIFTELLLARTAKCMVGTSSDIILDGKKYELINVYYVPDNDKSITLVSPSSNTDEDNWFSFKCELVHVSEMVDYLLEDYPNLVQEVKEFIAEA